MGSVLYFHNALISVDFAGAYSSEQMSGIDPCVTIWLQVQAVELQCWAFSLRHRWASLTHNVDLFSTGGRQEWRFEQSLGAPFNGRSAYLNSTAEQALNIMCKR